MIDNVLSDEQILKAFNSVQDENPYVWTKQLKAVTEAQVAHCEPLIRRHVAREILSRIEGMKADHSKECGWSYHCKGDHPEESCTELICTTSCKWWQWLKEDYGAVS